MGLRRPKFFQTKVDIILNVLTAQITRLNIFFLFFLVSRPHLKMTESEFNPSSLLICRYEVRLERVGWGKKKESVCIYYFMPITSSEKKKH